MSQPVLHLIVGPNGAGKSTLFARVIGPATHLPFVNADQIAAQRWPGEETAHAYDAAEAASQERLALIEARVSFVAETVFSHPSKLELLTNATEAGYLTTLHVVMIPTDLAVARVEARVVNGGHDVPRDKILARAERLWAHVVSAIALADEVVIYDNSKATAAFREVARFINGRLVRTADWPKWTPAEFR